MKVLTSASIPPYYEKSNSHKNTRLQIKTYTTNNIQNITDTRYILNITDFLKKTDIHRLITIYNI